MPQRTIARREDDTPPPARGSVIGDNLPSLAGDAERLFDEMLAEREGFNDRVEALVDAGKRADALQIEDMDEGTAGRLGDTVVQVRAVIRVVEDAERGVLVGASVVGPAGGEILGHLALAVHAEVPAATLRTMIYAYPTFHRAIESALDDLG